MKWAICCVAMLGIVGVGKMVVAGETNRERETKRLRVFEKELRKLVGKYYPDATFSVFCDKKTGLETIHFEYSVYPIVVCQRKKGGSGDEVREVRTPYVGGIMGDMTLDKGHYSGDMAGVEKGVTQVGAAYYDHLFAPYSKTLDCNLTANLRFPAGTLPEFVKEFKELTRDFESYVVKSDKEQKKEPE